MVSTTNFNELLKEIERIVNEGKNKNDIMLNVCKILNEKVSHYDWVGFYLVDPESPRELVLGPFVGEPTEHVRIPFGRGICGQAAEREITFVVQDVSKETNYLSCSPKVKSEIVVPIFKNGKVVGELDIDSHVISPFTEEDRMFLEKVCEMIARIL